MLLEVAREVLATTPGAVRDFEPVVRFKGFAESSIPVLVVLRANEYAERVAIVREGRLVAVESIATLKERAIRRVEIRLAAPAQGLERLRDVPGVRDLVVDARVVDLEIEGSMDALVKELAAFPVQTLTSEAPDLDEIFQSYYGRASAD